MSEAYFKNKLSKDDKVALANLKKAQPEANWTATKYTRLMNPTLYDSYSQKTNTVDNIYSKGLDQNDKIALSNLKKAQPQMEWTAEKYLMSNNTEKYFQLKNEADKVNQGQGKYRDLLFYEYLDYEDKRIFKALKKKNPAFTAEEYIKQSEPNTFEQVYNTIDSYNNGNLYYDEDIDNEEYYTEEEEDEDDDNE